MTAVIESEGPIADSISLAGHIQNLFYAITVVAGRRRHTQRGSTRERCLWGIRQLGFEVDDLRTAVAGADSQP